MSSVIDPNKNIAALDRKVLGPLYVKLNLDNKWKELLHAIHEERYQLSPDDVGMIERASNDFDGSAKALIQKLGSLGMTLKKLVVYLDRIHMESLPDGLRPDEPLVVSGCIPEVLTVVEGEHISLTCNATGYPKPKYEWFKEEELLDCDQETLVIPSASLNSAGKYKCRVHNQKFEKYSNWSKVIVVPNPAAPKCIDKSPPQKPHERTWRNKGLPIILEEPTSISVFRQSEARLSCVADGSPQPYYQWYKNGQMLAGQVTSELLIPQCVSSHHGLYHCQVHNQHGVVNSRQAEIIVHSTKVPNIFVQPKSQSHDQGGIAKFFVQAVGIGPLQYQWFHKGQPIPGAQRADYERKVGGFYDEGSYQCQVTSLKTGKSAMSKQAHLSYLTHQKDYTAGDKIALLVGNCNYQCTQKLPGTALDLLTLTTLLRDLNFKVISLFDLEKNELFNAIDDFCDLLDRGVYGVFYFAGHGLQFQNEHHLLGTDVKTGYTDSEQHVSLSYLLMKIQEREPDLTLIMLDMCRTVHNMLAAHPPRVYTPKVTGKMCIFFATGDGKKAMEDQSVNKGIFVTCLEKVIPQKKDVRDVFKDLQQEMRKNYKDLMVPEVHFDLSEARTLHDEICYRGETEQFDIRCFRWEQSQVPPDDIQVKLRCGISMEISFLYFYTNKLKMTITCGHPAKKDYKVVNVSLEEVNLQVHCDAVDSGYHEQIYIFLIGNLHKLTTDLTFNLRLDYIHAQGISKETLPLNLGMPMAANLKLTRPSQALAKDKPK